MRPASHAAHHLRAAPRTTRHLSHLSVSPRWSSSCAFCCVPLLGVRHLNPPLRFTLIETRRHKSNHHLPPKPSSIKSIVHPKPSDPQSVLDPDARLQQPGLASPQSRDASQPDQQDGTAPGSPASRAPRAAQPPPSLGPPRLVRYERLPDGSIAAWYDAQNAAGSGPTYPPSLITSYALKARIEAAAAQRNSGSQPNAAARSVANAAKLFSLHPATTANAVASAVASAEHELHKHHQQKQQEAEQNNADQMTASAVRQRAAAATTTSKEAAASAAHSHSHSHSHAHGGHHGHDHGGSVEEADALLAALKGKGDRGSNITLVGLASNIGLCASKGVAGVYLNSASLLADAAHSLSDLFADLVTLFCWKMSQKPANESHPLGYGKYETMGGLGVSLVLVAGAVGIGMHSYSLLLDSLQPTLQNAPAAIQALSHFTGSISHAAEHSHSHGIDTSGPLDPNAMWFALLSIIVKEWLYRATLKIAREENSSVLEANALHHRSDSLSSGVTFLAIGGSYLGFPVLDPLGGLLVAGLIGKQGAELLLSALGELSDRGVDASVLRDFDAVLLALQARPEFDGLLIGWKGLRAVKSGVSTFVDVTLEMPPDTRLSQARQVEEQVRKEITAALKGVKEVRVHLDAVQR